MRRIIRFFSDDLHKIQLNKDQYIPRNEPKVKKVPISPAESSENMKKILGEDYKTPYEKYDLHVPRVEFGSDQKSSFDRHHEKTNYAQSKRLIQITIAIGLISVYYIYKDNQKKNTIFDNYTKYRTETVKQRKLVADFPDKRYKNRND